MNAYTVVDGCWQVATRKGNWRDDWVTPTDKLVFMRLAFHAHIDGSSVYPSIAAIMRFTGLCRRAVQYALRKLERLGLIAAVGTRSVRRTVNRRLQLDKIRTATQAQPVENPPAEPAPPPPPEPVGVHSVHPEGACSAPKEEVKEIKDKSTGALRRLFQRRHRTPDKPSDGLLVKLAHEAIDKSHREDQSGEISNYVAHLKDLCASRHLAYDTPQRLTGAVASAITVRGLRPDTSPQVPVTCGTNVARGTFRHPFHGPGGVPCPTPTARAARTAP